jgi:cbb3-type cytochrome oxidase subunit 3
MAQYWSWLSVLAILSCLTILTHATGSFEDFTKEKSDPLSAVEESSTGAPYLTEYVIKSNKNGDQEPQRCAQRVLDSRRLAKESNSIESGVKPTVGLGAALLIFLFVGVFAAGIAYAFQMVRKNVYHDADNLDTAFDAGGKVSIGLTATTIVSQWTWSATLLQSSTVASKYGISGPYWYAGGATIQIIIFSILSIMLKTRAPGAKTFLQVTENLIHFSYI